MKEQNKETFIYIIFWAILITGGVLFMNWWKGDTPANKPQIAQETYEYKCIINDINDKHPIPIPTNHSIILCKNGYKIGKTGWFSLLGKVL